MFRVILLICQHLPDHGLICRTMPGSLILESSASRKTLTLNHQSFASAHDCDDDGEHAVTECFQSVLLHERRIAERAVTVAPMRARQKSRARPGRSGPVPASSPRHECLTPCLDFGRFFGDKINRDLSSPYGAPKIGKCLA